MKGTFFLLSKSRLGSYRPHNPIEGYILNKSFWINTKLILFSKNV